MALDLSTGTTNTLSPLDIELLQYLYYETDCSVIEIARRLKMHRSTVYRRIQCFELFGEAYAPSGLRRGRLRLLSMDQELVSEFQLISTSLIAL